MERHGYKHISSQIFHNYIHITFAYPAGNYIKSKVKNLATKCDNIKIGVCVCVSVIILTVSSCWDSFVLGASQHTDSCQALRWSEWLFWSTPSSHPRPSTDGRFQHQCPKDGCPGTKKFYPGKLEGKTSLPNKRFGFWLCQVWYVEHPGSRWKPNKSLV